MEALYRGSTLLVGNSNQQPFDLKFASLTIRAPLPPPFYLPKYYALLLLKVQTTIDVSWSSTCRCALEK